MNDPGELLPAGEAARKPATAAELDAIAAGIEHGLRRGAVGVGFALDYTPAASQWEILRMFRLASAYGAAGFVHIRGASSAGSADREQGLLEAIAHSAGVADAIVALLPAGRGEVFVQMFSTANGAVTASDSPQHLSPERAIDKYIDRAGILWAGEAAQLHCGLIQQRATTAGYRFVVADKEEVDPVNDAWIITVPALTLAEHVASLALIRAQAGLQITANSLKAIYVRPSDPEMKV